MKRLLSTALTLTVLSGTVVIAQPEPRPQPDASQWGDPAQQQGNHRDWRRRHAADKKPIELRKGGQRPNDKRAFGQRDNQGSQAPGSPWQDNRNRMRGAENGRFNGVDPGNMRRWSRGDRLPVQYRQRRYYVNDWQQNGLSRPPRGYHWLRDDHNDFFLAAISTGLISSAIYPGNREQMWNQRYHRTYTYHDDVNYRQCRNALNPTGTIVGAMIGGLLGHATSGGRTGATVAGVVVGGAVGAALTSNFNCEDRSYAYRTYYTGFNSGRANRSYGWRNPQDDHRGTLRVGRFYNDPDGFRCVTFSQTAYIGRRRQIADGNACRQPDGTWAVLK